MPSAGDLLTVRIVASFDGQPIINVYSFDLITPGATWSETAQNLIDALDAALGIVTGGGFWTASRASGYVVGTVEVIDVSPGTAPLYSVASSAVGDVEEAGMPPNDSLCVTLRSDFKGAGGRGRTYLSGWPRLGQVSGFWGSDPQDAASAIMSALTEGFGEGAGGAMARWCVLHKVAAGTPIVPPEVKPIMSTTIHNEVRSLGRRAMGRRISRRPAP
jgi:hypothetical protein